MSQAQQELEQAVGAHRALTERRDEIRVEIARQEARAGQARHDRDRDTYADARFELEDLDEEQRELAARIREAERTLLLAELEVAWETAEGAVRQRDSARSEQSSLTEQADAIHRRWLRAGAEERIDIGAERDRLRLAADEAKNEANRACAEACAALEQVDELEKRLGEVIDGPGLRRRPRRVVSTVYVTSPVTGAKHGFEPGTRLPRWAALLVTNDQAFDLERLRLVPDWVEEEHPDWVAEQRRLQAAAAEKAAALRAEAADRRDIETLTTTAAGRIRAMRQ